MNENVSKTPSIIDAQLAHNLEAVEGWETYQTHRQMVMQLLLPAGRFDDFARKKSLRRIVTDRKTILLIKA